jgi:hypothetical protein
MRRAVMLSVIVVSRTIIMHPFYQIEHDNSMSCSFIQRKNIFGKRDELYPRFLWRKHFRLVTETEYPRKNIVFVGVVKR